VLVLIDVALNFVNRHRAMAEQFYAFIQNLTAEVTFDSSLFLLTKARAASFKSGPPDLGLPPTLPPTPTLSSETATASAAPEFAPGSLARLIRVTGSIPPELWNRLGTKVLSKLRASKELEVGVSFEARVDAATADALVAELRQALEELGAPAVTVTSSAWSKS